MSHKKTPYERQQTAARLRNLLVRAGLTQTDLAEQLGTSRNDVWRWCAGKAEPSPARYLALHAALSEHIRNLTLETVMGVPPVPRSKKRPDPTNAPSDHKET